MRKWIATGLFFTCLVATPMVFASTSTQDATVARVASEDASSSLAFVPALDDADAPAACAVESARETTQELFGLGGWEEMTCRQISPGCFYAFNPDTLCCEEITGNLCPTAPCLY